LLLSWAPPFITPPFAEQLRLERGTSIHLLRLMFCASNDIYSTVLKIGNGTGALVFACREPMEWVRRTQTYIAPVSWQWRPSASLPCKWNSTVEWFYSYPL
jgi:hypothetical protein